MTKTIDTESSLIQDISELEDIQPEELKTIRWHDSELRVIMRDDELCFVLKDVCAALGLTNPSHVIETLNDYDFSSSGEVTVKEPRSD